MVRKMPSTSNRGLPALHYDRYSAGARAYAALAGEFVKRQREKNEPETPAS